MKIYAIGIKDNYDFTSRTVAHFANPEHAWFDYACRLVEDAERAYYDEEHVFTEIDVR